MGYKYKVKPQISRYFTKGKPQLVLSLSCYAFNSLTITPARFVNVPLLVLQLLYTGLTEHFYFKNRCKFVDLGHRWFCGFTWLGTSQMLMSFWLIFYALKMLWTKETSMYSGSGLTTANALLLLGLWPVTPRTYLTNWRCSGPCFNVNYLALSLPNDGGVLIDV